MMQQHALSRPEILCGYYICTTTTLSSQTFSGDLIISAKHCNGKLDCKGGEDEQFCPDPEHSFNCTTTGKIIESSKVSSSLESGVSSVFGNIDSFTFLSLYV